MKKISILWIVLFLPLLTFCQEGPVDKLFDKYSGQEGFTSVYISSYMFSMFANMESGDEDLEEMQKALSGLKSIKILAVDDEAAIPKGINFYKEIEKQLPMDKYQELMVVKEKDQDFKFLIREEKGKVVELLMIGGGNDNVLIAIQGIIDLKSISKLSESFDIEGMENLEKLEEKK